MLSETTKAYIAGIFDGEGTCCLALSKTTQLHHSQCYQPNVCISNTSKSLLESIRRDLWLGLVDDGRQEKEQWKRGYKLYFRQHQIVPFLALILPYLRLKKRQAELLIEFCSLKARGTQVTDEAIARRRAIYNELAELNKRGV